MNIPRFTGEASLYKTTQNYQSDRNRINLLTSIIGAVNPAFINTGINTKAVIDCLQTCVGAGCVGCLEKGISGDFVTDYCPDYFECDSCISGGPSIFSPGYQFCYENKCQPTDSGNCQCSREPVGLLPCRPLFDLKLTR